MNTKDIVMQYVCPSLGTIMSTAMYVAPIKSLRQALARGSLKDLNPTPWAFMTGNCLGWVAYSFVIQDAFVLASSLPGLILTVWLNVGAAKLQYMERSYELLRMTAVAQNDFDSSSYSLRFELNTNNDKNKNNNVNNGDGIDVRSTVTTATSENSNNSNHESTNSIENGENVGRSNNTSTTRSGIAFQAPLPSSTRHEYLILQILIVWSTVLSFVMFKPMSNGHRAEIVGIAVNLNLVALYGAPLSTILKVLRTRSSRSIHRGLLAMGLLNSFFWSVYGLAILDMIQFIPNFSGFVLSIIQLILCIVCCCDRSKGPEHDFDDKDGQS